VLLLLPLDRREMAGGGNPFDLQQPFDDLPVPTPKPLSIRSYKRSSTMYEIPTPTSLALPDFKKTRGPVTVKGDFAVRRIMGNHDWYFFAN